MKNHAITCPAFRRALEWLVIGTYFYALQVALQLRIELVDLTAVTKGGGRVACRAPDRSVRVDIEPGLQAQGDAATLRVVMENLLGNAADTSQRPRRNCRRPILRGRRFADVFSVLR
jgi:hypothetical protein